MKLLTIFLTVTAVSQTARAVEAVDSLSLPTEKTDWVDPIRAVPVGTSYVLYPTAQRGAETVGSCMVYLPPQYYTDQNSSFPVVYYLHGGTGNQREASWMIQRVDSAIRAGAMQPLIVVSPQALPIGWYVNANPVDPKVTSGPIHDIIIADLIPYIDNHFRTVAAPEGRGIEGFSMGGRGALMIAFRHPELFGAVSSVAGAVVDWDEEPLQRSLECTFGDVDSPLSRTYFEAWHPRTFACLNARRIKADNMKIRMFVGDSDRLYEENGRHITGRFHSLLDSLGIAHTMTIVPGANHNPCEIFDPAVNVYDTSFWDEALTGGTAQIVVLPETLSSFVQDYFPGRTVERVIEEEDPRGIHRDLLLDDGTLLRFNEHDKWILADRTAAGGATLPDTLVLSEITSAIAADNPSVGILRVEKVPRTGYRLLLTDATTRLFDTTGQPL